MVNKRHFNFNKKDRAIFTSPKNYTESQVRQLLIDCGMTVIVIKRNKYRHQDEILFRDNNFIQYTITQYAPELKSDKFILFIHSMSKEFPSSVLGEFKGLTKTNIKKLVKKIKADKYINYIDVRGLLKEYHSIIKGIEKSDKVFNGITLVNEVLPQSEIDNLLASISNPNVPKRKTISRSELEKAVKQQ